MSALPAIRAALETQLASISPPIDTAYENMPYVPTTGTPYQQVTLLPAQPNNVEIGPAWIEQGIFQVNLFYPITDPATGLAQGAGPAVDRAELIRAAFPYRASFTSGAITVIIVNTTEVGPARPDDDTFMVPVRVRWQARVSG